MIMVRQRLIIKIEHKTLSKTELTFFENERTLKKKYTQYITKDKKTGLLDSSTKRNTKRYALTFDYIR